MLDQPRQTAECGPARGRLEQAKDDEDMLSGQVHKQRLCPCHARIATIATITLQQANLLKGW